MTPEPLILKRRVWSQNEQRRVHWSRLRKERDHWLTLLHVALVRRCGALRVPKPEHKVKVTIVSYRNRLIDDKANLIGGCKELVDALVLVGLMVDDADIWADFVYEQHQCPKSEERTEVTVEELKP